jgi:large-conductance mechanosensitive channel
MDTNNSIAEFDIKDRLVSLAIERATQMVANAGDRDFILPVLDVLGEPTKDYQLKNWTSVIMRTAGTQTDLHFYIGRVINLIMTGMVSSIFTATRQSGDVDKRLRELQTQLETMEKAGQTEVARMIRDSILVAEKVQSEREDHESEFGGYTGTSWSDQDLPSDRPFLVAMAEDYAMAAQWLFTQLHNKGDSIEYQCYSRVVNDDGNGKRTYEAVYDVEEALDIMAQSAKDRKVQNANDAMAFVGKLNSAKSA